MAKRKYRSEEIIHELREANVPLGQGKTVDVAMQLGIPIRPTSAGAKLTVV